MSILDVLTKRVISAEERRFQSEARKSVPVISVENKIVILLAQIVRNQEEIIKLLKNPPEPSRDRVRI